MINKTPSTLKEIAKILKVSVSTVSRALHNHPSIGLTTTTRVHELAKELSYERNQSAIFFKERKTYTIGVILPSLSEPFFSAAISGIEDFAAANDYNVIMGQSLDDFEREKRILENMKTHRVDGMLVSITKETSNYDHFNQLSKYNIPIVFFDRVPDKKEIHCVACNLESGMFQAIQKLTESGHSLIGLINGPHKLFASRQRLEIYAKGLRAAGISFESDLIVSTDLTRDGNTNALHQLLSLKQQPTAIIVFNDYVLLDCMSMVKRAGLIMNKDVSFISFANLPLWQYMDTLPLASIEQFPYKQGEKATEILFQLMRSNEPETLYNQVIIDSQMITYCP
ncbi:LacI family DNA-binding transcriptional regulator [Arcticibacter eurypsychrophilus]|uniref:LacI family DNA-binding transcriptional regulator n=1 Tax=Arcticibacter eurypsychrophilus TaxID=1434752 RepID=UPI00084D0072|nr:LacI family DNA-binding transcriptional regulator [Arcticibacter eurypsychrophilus]